MAYKQIRLIIFFVSVLLLSAISPARAASSFEMLSQNTAPSPETDEACAADAKSCPYTVGTGLLKCLHDQKRDCRAQNKTAKQCDFSEKCEKALVRLHNERSLQNSVADASSCEEDEDLRPKLKEAFNSKLETTEEIQALYSALNRKNLCGEPKNNKNNSGSR